ncbi:hypothetical protein [Microbacterium sp. BR1]|uniref:hypothetical protein n=1 Tax=Microbacterium sp. BR1 TaxID=1070896 RepID=UPI0012FE5EE9|nr:hypothetical protein [Microbacterium sp. BR1]
MTKLPRRAMASFMVVSALMLSACAAEPERSSSSSPTPTPTPSQSPSPTPTPEPIAQAFGGDCAEMLSDAEVSDLFGPPIELDPVREARQRIAEEASVIREGGIVCNWVFDQVGLGVVVLPVSVVPPELHVSVPEEACMSGFTDCSWRTVSGPWWMETTEWPTSSYETWAESPERVEALSQMIAPRVLAWSPPAVGGAAEPLLDCTELLAAVNAAVPAAGLVESGWGIAGLEAIALMTNIVESCAWSNESGIISLRVQRDVGAPDSADLRTVGAEEYSLPNGVLGHLVMLAPEYGTLVATAGDTRVAISGDSVANDEQGTAAILAAVLDAL